MYGIFTYIWSILMVNVGDTMDHTWILWEKSPGPNMFGSLHGPRDQKRPPFPVGIQACQAIGLLQAGHNFHIQHDDLSACWMNKCSYGSIYALGFQTPG